jgi:multicomponent Na+:H+ antiporter subunit E
MANSNRRRTIAPRGFLNLWVVLFVVWMAANSTIEVEVALLGAVISGVFAYAFTKSSGGWRQIHWGPSGFYHFLVYSGVFLVELVKANLAMLRIVYSPRIHIRPGIVKVRTRLRSAIGRLALANTIALTPGSLVIDIKDDVLYIHWLDVKSTDAEIATAAIAGPFEKHLEQVFG